MKVQFLETKVPVNYFLKRRMTFLRQHGILSEYIDLLQGRIPKSVFARRYLKVEDVKELVEKLNAISVIM